MKITRFALLASLGLAPLAAQTIDSSFFFEKGRIRVLILSGRNNHEWRTSTPHLRRILEATERFDVHVTEEPAGLTAEALAPYDVLVSDYCGPRWGDPAESAVQAFVRNGKGLVVVHAASYPFGVMAVLGSHMSNTQVKQSAWTAWTGMVGARWQEADPAKGIQRTGHDARHVYEVKWVDAAHPVAAGMPASFTVSDELYRGFVFAPSIHILATAFDDPKFGGTGKDEPLLWTNAYGQGRVFHTGLGHDVPAMMAPGFIASFARGVEWAATGKVSLPVEIVLEPKDANAVRVLLATGGHDHEASLYGVFDHDRMMKVTVNPHPVAFSSGMEKHYDVIALYDMVQEVPEAQKKALAQYLESGHGLVVLHHAIANFQSWPWWWKEVVGGRYLLQDDPSLNMKASSYKHDVDFKVVPVGKHPILQGLAEMWVHDETYKGMWHAPGITPLLTTAETTSDEPIAWISPYAKARVVYIELGHGREVHENPWYCRLVKNAILWSAGR
jgi:type 1 glutamine amidotransferase